MNITHIKEWTEDFDRRKIMREKSIKRIASKGILILMGLATILGLFGCSRVKKDSELEAFEYRVSGYNSGYYIRLENGKIIYDNYDEGTDGKLKANEATISEIKKLFKDLDVYSWDGFKECDEFMLDGMGFTLYVKFADGTSINASGSNLFPKNFNEFDEAICSLVFDGKTIDVKSDANDEEPICGGTTNNTDYNAPKEIESDKLVSLSVGFYHEFKFDTGSGMFYTFYLEPDENGKLILKDNRLAEGFEVDSSVLDGAQQIIKENNLAAVNGIHKTTAGLPPEYQPCYIEAKYDSGEYISYSENSDPSSAWGEDFVDYFGQIMADNGDDKYLASKLTGAIRRFCLEVLHDDLIYTYDTVNVPSKGEKLNRRIYDTAKEELLEDTVADQSPEYYEGLMQIISDYEIRDFENYDTVSDLVDYDNPTDYYDFYIEFESGDTMSGASVDPDVLEAFKTIEEQLVKYMNDYFDNH